MSIHAIFDQVFGWKIHKLFTTCERLLLRDLSLLLAVQVCVVPLDSSSVFTAVAWHTVASSPGHSQILSRSHGCEIKSGSGLGTRLGTRSCSVSTSDRAHFRILLTLKGEDPGLAHPQEIITRPTPCKAKLFATGNQGSSGVATYHDLLYAATQAGWTHRSPASSRNLKPKRVSCNLADNYYTLVQWG